MSGSLQSSKLSKHLMILRKTVTQILALEIYLLHFKKAQNFNFV